MSYKLQNYNGYEYTLSKSYVKKIIKYVEKYAVMGASILELGCWAGDLLKYLKDKGYIVKGYELNSSAIEECVKKNIEVVKQDLSKSFYSDIKYDFIIAAEVIEHIYDTGRFLSDIYNLLSDNGYLILSTPNVCCLRNRIRCVFGKYPDHLEFDESGSGHIRVYNKQVLINQMRQKGFDVVLVSSSNFPFPVSKIKVPSLLLKVLLFMGDLFPTIGNQLIVVAKKKH